MFFTKVSLIVTLLVSFLNLTHACTPKDKFCRTGNECCSKWCSNNQCICKKHHAACIRYPNGCIAANCCSGLIVYDKGLGHVICKCLWKPTDVCSSNNQCCSYSCNSNSRCDKVEPNNPCWDSRMCLSRHCGDDGFCT